VRHLQRAAEHAHHDDQQEREIVRVHGDERRAQPRQQLAIEEQLVERILDPLARRRVDSGLDQVEQRVEALGVGVDAVRQVLDLLVHRLQLRGGGFARALRRHGGAMGSQDVADIGVELGVILVQLRLRFLDGADLIRMVLAVHRRDRRLGRVDAPMQRLQHLVEIGFLRRQVVLRVGGGDAELDPPVARVVAQLQLGLDLVAGGLPLGADRDQLSDAEAHAVDRDARQPPLRQHARQDEDAT
jgi:hypothetical protein